MGRSFRSPLSGSLLRTWHFGQLIVSRPWLEMCQCFKHCRQKLWRHGRCLGSVYMLVQTGQETSSRRLWSNVLISMASPSFSRRERAQWLEFSEIDSKQWSHLTLFSFFKAFFGICYGCFSTASANQGSLSLKYVMEWFFINTDSQDITHIWLLVISSWRQLLLLSSWREEFSVNHKFFCPLSFALRRRTHLIFFSLSRL